MTCAPIRSHLRTLARERIKRDVLPPSAHMETWGGHGNGEVCSLCDNPIGSEDIEYEMAGVVNGTHRIYRFHLECHTAWEVEITPNEGSK